MSNQTIERVRFIMAPANPVPSYPAVARPAADRPGEDATLSWILAQPTEADSSPEPKGSARAPRPGRPAGRVLAPIGAGLAVAGLVTGLTLGLQSPKPLVHRPVAGAPTATEMPKLFVTLEIVTNGRLFAEVRDSRTGQVLSRVHVPGFFGTYPNVAADGSDRSFL